MLGKKYVMIPLTDVEYGALHSDLISNQEKLTTHDNKTVFGVYFKDSITNNLRTHLGIINERSKKQSEQK